MIHFLKKSKQTVEKKEYVLTYKCKCGFYVPEWKYKNQNVIDGYHNRTICPKCGGLTNQFEKKIIKV